jgi:hypothetical protein
LLSRFDYLKRLLRFMLGNLCLSVSRTNKKLNIEIDGYAAATKREIELLTMT